MTLLEVQQLKKQSEGGSSKERPQPPTPEPPRGDSESAPLAWLVRVALLLVGVWLAVGIAIDALACFAQSTSIAMILVGTGGSVFLGDGNSPGWRVYGAELVGTIALTIGWLAIRWIIEQSAAQLGRHGKIGDRANDLALSLVTADGWGQFLLGRIAGRLGGESDEDKLAENTHSHGVAAGPERVAPLGGAARIHRDLLPPVEQRSGPVPSTSEPVTATKPTATQPNPEAQKVASPIRRQAVRLDRVARAIRTGGDIGIVGWLVLLHVWIGARSFSALLFEATEEPHGLQLLVGTDGDGVNGRPPRWPTVAFPDLFPDWGLTAMFGQYLCGPSDVIAGLFPALALFLASGLAVTAISTIAGAIAGALVYVVPHVIITAMSGSFKDVLRSWRSQPGKVPPWRLVVLGARRGAFEGMLIGVWFWLCTWALRGS